MPITNKATITLWNEEKGFGFATANGIKYFVHISALGHPVRPPKIGDTIIICSFGKTEKGAKIEKGILEGVVSREEQADSTPVRKNYRKAKKSKIAVIVAICIALAFAFDIYVVYTTPDDAPRKKKVCLLKENPAETPCCKVHLRQRSPAGLLCHQERRNKALRTKDWQNFCEMEF